MEILKQVKDIHSVSVKEGQLLFKLAQRCMGRGVIVEIGSWKGYSTICLAKGSQDGNGVLVYAIDPHTGAAVHRERYGVVNTYSVFMENITTAGVSGIVAPMVMTSQKAEEQWDVPIELLWIDGDHMLADKDLEIWFPHVMDGGTIALHDTTTWKNPHKTAMGMYKSAEFKDIERVGSITYAVKTSLLTWTDKLVKSDALYRRYVYQATLPSYNRVKIIAAKILGRY
jgi:predicted O-methyltransferase YrrM